MMVVDLKTFIPEKGVWVSTVAHDMPIGIDRCAETMVFRGDKDGITDWYDELYFESHGYTTDREVLRKAHERIVDEIKRGIIQI